MQVGLEGNQFGEEVGAAVGLVGRIERKRFDEWRGRDVIDHLGNAVVVHELVVSFEAGLPEKKTWRWKTLKLMMSYKIYTIQH